MFPEDAGNFGFPFALSGDEGWTLDEGTCTSLFTTPVKVSLTSTSLGGRAGSGGSSGWAFSMAQPPLFGFPFALSGDKGWTLDNGISPSLFTSPVKASSTSTSLGGWVGSGISSGWAFSMAQPPLFLGPLHKEVGTFFSVVWVTVVSSEFTLLVDLFTLRRQFPLPVSEKGLWCGVGEQTEFVRLTTGESRGFSGSRTLNWPLKSEEVGIFLNLEKSFLTMWSWDWFNTGSFFLLLASSSSFLRSDTFRNISWKKKIKHLF